MRPTVSSFTPSGHLAQPRYACIINRVGNYQQVTRPDPEVQAGRALRRLRLSHGWSQEEVARLMQAYGYDFHQTMIAKIEAAQRPLRVRELADFAVLYGVGVHELIYPPSGSPEEIDQEIAEVATEREAIQRHAEEAAYNLDSARAALVAAEETHRTLASQLAMLAGRLAFLQDERNKFAHWETSEGSAPSQWLAGHAAMESFSDFAQRESESLIGMLSQITELPVDESRELVQLALAEVSAKWEEPEVATKPREWVLGCAIWLYRNSHRSLYGHPDRPSVTSAVRALERSLAPASDKSPSADVWITGALAVAASATPEIEPSVDLVRTQPNQVEFPFRLEQGKPSDRAKAVPEPERVERADQLVTALYHTHYRSLVRLAMLLARDLPMAEETVQDSFVNMYSAVRNDRLKGDEDALHYLRQSVITRSRSARRHRMTADRNAPKPEPDTSTTECTVTGTLEERSAVTTALRSLPARQREALVLRYYADLSEEQVAQAMGISRSAVRVNTARAKSALRSVLGDK
jgi:RNA polymerase sigma factor (sigma-70 family)